MPNEYIAVVIDDIDLPTRSAWAYDKTGVRNKFWFRESPGGVLYIPKQGEAWTAMKRGTYWYLDKKLDSSQEHADMVASMSPGDVRLGTAEASDIFLRGNLLVNGNPPASGILRHEFFVDTSFDIVTLQEAPGPSPMIFLDGLLVAPPQWAVSDKTLTFDPPLLGGNLSVYF